MAERLESPLAGLLSYFTRHRTAANLVLLIMIALGVAAYPRMRAQFFPDVTFDSVIVSVAWDGAGAEDIDEAVVQVLEPALQNVEGITSTFAVSTEGRARITLEFETGWSMDRAADDTKAAVDAVSGLPSGVEEPVVTRRSWQDRVTDIVITGPVSVDQLGRLADEFAAELFSNGISRASIRGVEAPRTIVEVPQVNLVRNNVAISEIASAIGEEAKADPSGEVGDAGRVRAGVAKRTTGQIEAIAVRSNPDGSKLLVGDFARVLIEGIDRRRAYFVGDNPAVSISVNRSKNGDAISLQERVEEIAEKMSVSLPDGVTIDLIRTRAELITNRLNLLYSNGLIGLALVISVLFIFLSTRVAFWVAAGIPAAMCATIAMMYAFGFTLNMVSLFGLIITLGMVVDDAIVVGEHADYRARNLGESPALAAENAAIRMSSPVFAASLTTIIAFFGLVAVGGRFGSLIADIPFTVIVVLAASLLECFLILPNHMSHALVHAKRDHWYDAPSRLVNRGFRWFRHHVFRPFIYGTIAFRYPVIAAAVLLLASQIALFVRGDVNWRFFNAPELGSVSGNFAMLPGANRSDSMEMMRELQLAVTQVGERYQAEFGSNPVDYVIAEVGGTTGRGLAGSDTRDTDLLGSIAVELIDADLRPYSSFEFVAELQDSVRRHPLLETLSFRGWRGGPGGDALDVQLYRADALTLKQAAESLKASASQFSEVSALEDDLAYDKDELILDLTPQGKALGFTIDGVGRVIRDHLGGVTAASFPLGTRTGEIIVRLPDSELKADFLDTLMMRTPGNEYVPLADIVSIARKSGFSTVRRENGLQVVSVTGDISEDDPTRALEIIESLSRDILPSIESEFGVSWRLSGLAEQENEFMDDARLGVLLVLCGIFLTLAWVFSSWIRPLVVMVTIPFGLVGAIYGHYLWDVPVSLFSVIGLIGMGGIIVNDSIVLISTVDEYSKSRGLIPSIIDAAANRLRPVLLTTLTTVVGLVPLLYETSQQASFLKPTVITLCYGLGFGMVLVLLLVPSLLAVQADVGKQIKSLKRAFNTPKSGRSLRWTILSATLLSALLFCGTVGYTVVEGRFPSVGLVPIGVQERLSPIMLGFVTFAAGSAAICALSFALAAILSRASTRRSSGRLL